MTEPNDRNAGTIILKDLALFNKAVIYFENEIDPLFRIEFEKTVADWLDAHSWQGETDVSDEFDELWLAPRQWITDPETDSCAARFRFDWRAGPDSRSFVIADLFGLGETIWGFRFKVDYGSFGGGRLWNLYAKTLAHPAQQLSEQGWAHEGKGCFFLPLTLPANRLAEAWDNEDWTETLAPLRQKLDALEAALPIFEVIMNGARQKNG